MHYVTKTREWFVVFFNSYIHSENMLMLIICVNRENYKRQLLDHMPPINTNQLNENNKTGIYIIYNR